MYQATKAKTELLEKAGYKVIEQWECELKKDLKQNQNLQDLVNTMIWVLPLNPREAFYRGRTRMAKCYHAADVGEEIYYEDFTSLYPTINKYGTYPIGHPTIVVNPENQNIHNYFGIALVDVLAPDRLFHPVLPVKINGKLMFPLCVKCVEQQQDRQWHERTNLCPHSEEEQTI